MKLRIMDNAVRFRITLRELETLAAQGELLATTELPGAEGIQVFRYGLRLTKNARQSSIRFESNTLVAELSPGDFATLSSESEEGVYVHREVARADGTPTRCMFFIEKDRPRVRLFEARTLDLRRAAAPAGHDACHPPEHKT